ncbi:MAG: PPC domain-containing DNA-binding protein [bacterium]
MKNSRSGNLHFVKLDKGEELISTVSSFANEIGVVSAFVTGIGVLKNIELGYFDVQKSAYDIKKLNGEFELVSLMGNIGRVDGKAGVHFHVVLSDKDFKCIGGHLLKADIGVTCEMVIASTDMKLERTYDPDTKLKLLSPSCCEEN